jgi:glycosyltransferase 2 family protein
MKDPRALVGVLVSLVAVVLLLYVVDVREVLAVVSRADPLAVAAVIGTTLVAMWLKAVRWRLFFPKPDEVRTAALHECLYIGYMVNTILPLRAGELVRALLAAETEHQNKSTTLATVVIEKVLDLGTIALLLALLGLVFPDLPESARYAAYLSGIGLTVVVVGIVFVLAARGVATRILLWLEKRVPPLGSLGVAGLMNAFLDGLAFAQNPVTLAWVIFWSVVQWGLSASTVMFALMAVGISGSSWYELLQMTLLVLVATNLSMAIPSAPGYVGVFHGVFVATLALFGVREELATAAAVVEHALVFGLFIVVGAYFLARGEAVRASGQRLGDLVSRAKADRHADH